MGRNGAAPVVRSRIPPGSDPVFFWMRAARTHTVFLGSEKVNTAAAWARRPMPQPMSGHRTQRRSGVVVRLIPTRSAFTRTYAARWMRNPRHALHFRYMFTSRSREVRPPLYHELEHG